MDGSTEDTTPERPRLSLVIPAYNEARRLPESLTRARAYLRAKGDQHDAWGACEVLVVDDGSTDATRAVVEAARAGWPALRLIRQEHAGKGAAVRGGILAARGDYVALADADFSMPVSQFDRFTQEVLGPYDIAIGSREAPSARRYGEPEYRHLMGRVFNRVVQLLLLPGIEDTQCGFKVLRRPVAVEVARRQTVEGWGFDVELLTIARRLGYAIREVGIDWHYIPDSRISPLRDTLTMLGDVLRIWRNSRRGRYGPTVQAAGKASNTIVSTSSGKDAGAPVASEDHAATPER
jgi:glycosyltransferase involved in cell wall biosynthesis